MVTQMFEGEVISVDADGQCQAYGRSEETLQRGDLRKFSDGYGFSSRSPAGTALVVAHTEGGDLAIIGEEPENRPELATDGQVMLWDKEGNKINLSPGGFLQILSQWGHHIKAQSAKIVMESNDGGQVTCTDDARVNGAKVELVSTTATKIGAATASQPIVKGTDFYSLFNTFFSNWQSALESWKTDIADDGDVTAGNTSTYINSTGTAVSTLLTGLSAILSTKNYIDV
jgi:phage gp45-like